MRAALQVFSYTIRQEIMTDDLCLDVSGAAAPIKMLKCHKMAGNQKWVYSKEVRPSRRRHSGGVCPRGGGRGACASPGHVSTSP